MDARASNAVEGDLDGRVLDAALALVEQSGVARTSLSDIARAAGCSRATLYRLFPGGKGHLFDALGRRELHRFLGRVAEAVSQEVDAESALTVALTTSAAATRDHAALQRVLVHEPGLLLPYLGFKQVDRLYQAVTAAGAPHLVRFVGAARASWAAEWVARLLVSFVFNPDAGIDLSIDADARRLVRAFLLPALAPAAARPEADSRPLVSPRSQ